MMRFLRALWRWLNAPTDPALERIEEQKNAARLLGAGTWTL